MENQSIKNFHQIQASKGRTISNAEEDKSTSKFPIVPVAVCVALVLAVGVIVALYYARSRRKNDKYKNYSQISNTSVQPSAFSVKTAKEVLTKHLKSPFILPEKLQSSEESLSPMSSEDIYYDAKDAGTERVLTPLSSRNVTPTSGLEDDEQDNEDDTDIYPIDHVGRLWFNLEYDGKEKCLKVTLVKIRNLPYRSKTVLTRDPFVKLHILPDEKFIAQSSCKRKTNKPTYNEVFQIYMAPSDLQRCYLRLSVYDGLRLRQQTIIGEVMFPLIEMEFGKITEAWRDLEKPSENKSELGDVHLSLCYYPTLDRITIIVLRAVNLKQVYGHETGSYAKVSFSIGNKIIKTKKTAVIKGTCDPMFNESFNFTVDGDELVNASLLVTIMQHRGGEGGERLVGRVLLGGMMYARGTELEHWNEMMVNSRKMIKYWHSLSV